MFKSGNTNSVICLEMSADGLTKTISLPPGEGRTALVGSTALADFCVAGVRSAPVALHLERRADTIWVVPAYEGYDLRLNGRRISGATPLEQHSVIEFGGAQLAVTIIVTDADVSSTPQLARARDASSRGDLPPRGLPGEHGLVKLGAQSAADPDEVETTTTIPRAMLDQMLDVDANSNANDSTPTSSLHEETTKRLPAFRQADLLRPQDDHPRVPIANGTESVPPHRATGPAPINRPGKARPHVLVAFATVVALALAALMFAGKRLVQRERSVATPNISGQRSTLNSLHAAPVLQADTAKLVGIGAPTASESGEASTPTILGLPSAPQIAKTRKPPSELSRSVEQH